MREKLLTTREVSQILGISEKDVIDLAKKGKIPSYKIDEEFLRFKKEEIITIRRAIQREFKVSPPLVDWRERLKEFLYFNDFYIISFLLIIFLLWIILKG